VALALATLPLLMSCGQIGPPLPPLRPTPTAPTELSLLQRGTQLFVVCRAPKASVDGLGLPPLDLEIIWLAGVGDLLKDGQRQVHRVAPGELLSTVIETLPESGSRVRVTARARSRRLVSRTAPVVTHSVREPPPPVATPTATRVSDGVRVAWAHPTEGMLFRVYRRPADGADAVPLTTAPVAEVHYDDRSDGVTAAVCYQVRAAGLPAAPVESEEAKEVCLDPAAPQPPAVPQGLAAVAAGAAVDLSWSPTSDPLVVSHRIYRAIGEEAPVACGEVSGAATRFRDPSAPTGQSLSYTVTALSRDGLESPPSAPAMTRLKAP
jgi:hypothetical protein